VIASVKRIFVVALGAAMLVGCGGGRSLPAPTALSAQGAQRVAGAIVLHVPSRTSSAARRVHYVAGTSNSAKIAIAAAPGCTQCSPPVTLEVSLTSAGLFCVGNPSGTTCTISLSLLPGTYIGSLFVYDGLLDGGGHVTGNTLSENTSFPIPIISGQPNSTGVTLAGVPRVITETILSPTLVYTTVGVQNSTPYTMYRLAGPNVTAQVLVNAKDADGNFIGGAGGPSYSASATGAGYGASASGSLITLTAPAAITKARGALTITLNSPGCADPAAVCTRTEQLGMAQTLGITDSGVIGGKKATAYIWTIGATGPRAAVTTGINGPREVAFAPDGTLFVANLNGQTVTAYAPPYAGNPVVIPAPGVNQQIAVVTDAAGKLYIGNSGTGTVTIYPPPYTTASGTLAATCKVLKFDAHGDLWCGGAGQVLRFLGGGTFVTASVTLPNNGTVQAIAIAPDGTLYVADINNNVLQRYDPSYTTPTTIVSTAAVPFGAPFSVGVAPDGTVLVAGSNGLAVYNSTGQPIRSLATPANTALRVALDDDGIAWVTTTPSTSPIGVPYPYDGTGIRPLTTSTTTFIQLRALALTP
jgi:sugar lactone lactonase YvrE